MKIEGLEKARAVMRGLSFSDNRSNSAIATALSRTAVEIRDAVKAELPKAFDRPTPYTLNSLFVRPATAARLSAETYFKDDRATSNAGTPPTKYLLPEVEGGPRRNKGFEKALQAAGHLPKGWFAVPGRGAKIDAYGSMSKGQLIQILSQLRITLVAGSTRNLPIPFRAKGKLTKDQAKNNAKVIRALRNQGGRFFVVKPGAKGAKQPGIYQRDFYSETITPIVIFVRAITYRRRLDFYGIAERVASVRLPANVERAINENVARLAARGG